MPVPRHSFKLTLLSIEKTGHSISETTGSIKTRIGGGGLALCGELDPAFTFYCEDLPFSCS